MDKLSKIREQLKQVLQERLSRAEQIDNRLRQPGHADWEEQATQRENDEVLESLGAQAHQEIVQIKEAIHRIDQGTYGMCSRCGQPIAPDRLKALPYVTTCIHC